MKKKIAVICFCLCWLSLSAALWFGPRQEISQSERRKLAQMPDFSLENVMNSRFMSSFEGFTQDQFPLREGFRRVNALFRYYALSQRESNGIYLSENQAVKLENGLNEKAVNSALDRLKAVCKTFIPHENKVIFALVPEKGAYLSAPSGRPGLAYDRLTALVSTGPWQTLPLLDVLDASSYYGSDLHWRQEAIVPAAQRLCDALEIPRPQNLEERNLGSFSGVYAGQSALPMDQDDMRILTNAEIKGCHTEIYGESEKQPVYDLQKFAGRDPYDVFLSGAAGLMTVTNPAAQPGKRLIVFRDSFGSSMVPLLLQGYEQVTLVDIRYLPSGQLGNLVDFEGADVLMLYSATVLNTPGILR